MMMAILSNMFAINKDARRDFGSSSRFTILRQELSCLVLRILTSLSLNEKKAIRDPETMKVMTRKKSIRITRMVVACALISKNKDGCPRAVNMSAG
jgi:hypothetical protein